MTLRIKMTLKFKNDTDIQMTLGKHDIYHQNDIAIQNDTDNQNDTDIQKTLKKL